jgi:hypothetical protein
MTGILGHEFAHTFIRGRLGSLEESFASLAAYRAVIAQGLADGYRKRDPIRPQRLETWPRLRFEEADPGKDGLDMARIPHDLRSAGFGKGMWIIESLEERYGSDFMSRYFSLLEQEGIKRRLRLNEVVSYMGEVAGEDLEPWFRSIGTWQAK